MQTTMNNLMQSYFRADVNRDNTLSRKEIAMEALKLKSEGKVDEFALMSTFLLGGQNGQGLFPDFANEAGQKQPDGKVGILDLYELALGDGKSETLSSDDFRAKFPVISGDGNTIDEAKLKQIAGETEPSSEKKVPLRTLLSRFLEADLNHDGSLSAQEIAQEALKLKAQNKNDEFSMFATFLQGGNNGKGIGLDSEGKLRMSHLIQLAGADGDYASLSASDFKAQYPGNTNEGGNTIDMAKLRQTAAGSSASTEDILSRLIQALFNRLRLSMAMLMR